MVRLGLLLLLSFPVFAGAQAKIGKNKSEVNKDLQAWISGHSSYSPKLNAAGNLVTLSIKDPGYGPVKFIYTFSKKDICISEKTVAATDSSKTNYLNSVLEQSGYEWKKINGNQYISKFDDKLMIELPGNPKERSFTVYRVDWTRELYDMLNKK